MRAGSLRFRVFALAAAAVLLLGSGPLWAQQESAAPDADPPGRVGRIARLSGTVSFHGAGQTDWEPAGLNLPVTSGAGVWTEPGARADVDVGDARIVVDSATQLEIDRLDERSMVATENQGSVYLRVRAVDEGETFTLQTPRGTVTINRPGSYVVSAGDSDTPTTVTTIDGEAQVSAPGVSELVGPHQTLNISGTDSFTGTMGPEQLPAFAAEQDRPLPVLSGPSAPPPMVARMTGGDAVMDTGSWEPTQDYGQVWYPPVEVGWVPYRHGHWAFIAPWGWTWVDDAPWGFAPFHYGRWVEVGPRWGWIPVLPGIAIYSRPVYAPALVAFVGFGAGFAAGIGFGSPVGWVPLGPREIYRPPYRVSNTYIRNVNVMNVTNVTNITNRSSAGNPSNFINRRAATVVPASAMRGSQSVAGVARPISAASLASARPINTAPVMPARNTLGVTPRTAQQLNLPPATTAQARPAAPGPAVRPLAQGAVPPLPSAASRAALGTAGAQAPRPGQPGSPGAAPLPGGQAPGRPPVSGPGQAAPGRPQVPQPGQGAAAPGPGSVRPTAPSISAPGQAAPGQPGLPALRPSVPVGQAPGRPQVPQPGQGAVAPGPGSARPTAPNISAPGQVAPGQPGLPALRPAVPVGQAPGRPQLSQPGQGGGGPGPAIQRPAAPIPPTAGQIAPGAVAPAPGRPGLPPLQAPTQRPGPQPSAQLPQSQQPPAARQGFGQSPVQQQGRPSQAIPPAAVAPFQPARPAAPAPVQQAAPPRPAFQAPPPVQAPRPVAPPPQVQRQAPPPQVQRAPPPQAPPPQVQRAPPPQAPQMQRQAPPPQVQRAPPPQAPPQQQQQHRSCPPNRPNC